MKIKLSTVTFNKPVESKTQFTKIQLCKLSVVNNKYIILVLV